MTKHVRKSRRRQTVERPPAATVRIPCPCWARSPVSSSYFELCIRAGQQVLDAMMEQDRTALCGPRWKRDPDRQASRAGTTPSEGTLGGRRIQLTRPRVRSQSGQEVELPDFAFASHRDPLAHHATRGSSLPDRADRWDRPGRPLGRGRARHRYRGQEAGAGVAGRPHRTQPRRQGAAARPRRARVGSGTRARLFVIDGAKALTSAIHPSVLSRSVSRPEAVPMRTCTELHSYQRPVCLRIAPQLIPGAVETWGDVPIYLCDALVLQRLRRAATLHRDSLRPAAQRLPTRRAVSRRDERDRALRGFRHTPGRRKETRQGS